jgi:hypothetical protein
VENSASLTTKQSCISNVPILAAASRKGFRQCSALLITCLLLIPFTHAQKANLPESINLAKKTVAPVVCLVRDQTGTQQVRFRILGTAFMVDTIGTFVTASHVISDLINTEPWKSTCKAAITFTVGGWVHDASPQVRWFTFEAGSCQVNTVLDIAVCQTLQNLSKETSIHFEVPSISNNNPLDGTAIFFTGFPLQATDPVTSVGTVAGYQAEGGYSTVLIDKNAWPGASGSPIFLDDGKTVVGVVLRTGTGDAAGISFGVTGDKVFHVLSEARNNWAAQRSKPEKDSNPKQK